MGGGGGRNLTDEELESGLGESVGEGLASADDLSTGDGLGDGVALACPALAHVAAQSARMKTARRGMQGVCVPSRREDTGYGCVAFIGCGMTTYVWCHSPAPARLPMLEVFIFEIGKRMGIPAGMNAEGSSAGSRCGWCATSAVHVAGGRVVVGAEISGAHIHRDEMRIKQRWRHCERVQVTRSSPLILLAAPYRVHEARPFRSRPSPHGPPLSSPWSDMRPPQPVGRMALPSRPPDEALTAPQCLRWLWGPQPPSRAMRLSLFSVPGNSLALSSSAPWPCRETITAPYSLCWLTGFENVLPGYQPLNPSVAPGGSPALPRAAWRWRAVLASWCG